MVGHIPRHRQRGAGTAPAIQTHFYPVEFVDKGKYLPLSKCFQKEECSFEVRVSSITAEQKIFAQAWANSIDSAIRNETMQYYLSELNIVCCPRLL